MFNYYNLLTYVFMDCILFKWKLSLFLDFLKYICILSGMRAKMIKLFKILQILRIFSKKKKIFFQKFWGAQALLGHQVALPLIMKSSIGIGEK